MWLIIVSLAAAIATAIWYIKDGVSKLSFLSLVLWGTTIMIFVDHTMGYLSEGGEFIEMTPNAILLGMVLVIIAIILWELMLIFEDPKGKIKVSLRKN
ncbi:MAG: hypothetical protein DRN12_05820 [Thermoplasmata archaeon]|nr:MAG: hypothetical protein DRN12_05820 [Thermoplasmata archaeon]